MDEYFSHPQKPAPSSKEIFELVGGLFLYSIVQRQKRWTPGSSIRLFTTRAARHNSSSQHDVKLMGHKSILIQGWLLNAWLGNACGQGRNMEVFSLPIFFLARTLEHKLKCWSSKQACWFVVSLCEAVFQIALFGTLAWSDDRSWSVACGMA